MEEILYVLLTGIPWRLLPPQFGPHSTLFDRFQQWSAAGVFERLWEQALLTYDEEVGIQWTWQAMDGMLTKAPIGGELTGPNPTDRAESGGKRRLLSDGNGIPLAVVLAPANRHDIKLFEATLEARRVLPPAVSQHLCLDKGYGSVDVRQTDRAYLFTPHIRPIGEEPRHMERNRRRRAPRSVVERTISWLNRCRRILVRWEKTIEDYLAMLELACAWNALQTLQRG